MPGLSCRCFLPRLQDVVHTFPVKASRYSKCSPGMERGWCLSSTARHCCPKSCCNLGVQSAMWLHQALGQPISWQDCALGRGGKAGEGKCFIRDTALSFVNSTGSTSSLQKAVQRKPGEKPTQRWHSRQARAKSEYFDSIMTKF